MGRILIVDDTLFMRTLLKNILSPEGTRSSATEDGDIGVTKYKELKPDLVTMDVVMPKMNGIEALKAIKALDTNAKVIMCTAVVRNRWLNLL